MAYTLNQVLVTIREFTFDRFPTPFFILKKRIGSLVTYSADFVASNSIAFTYGGESISPVVYATSHTATFNSLVTAISGLTTVAKVVGDPVTRKISIIPVTQTALPSGSSTVTAGVSQPTASFSEGTITLTNGDDDLVIKMGVNTLLTVDYATYPTLYDLTQKLIVEGYHLAHTGYFKGEEPPTNLLYLTNAPLSTAQVTMLSKKFFSDETLEKLIREYYNEVMQEEVALEDIEDSIAELTDKTVAHLTLFVSCWVVDQRRLNEYAASVFPNDYFSDGSGRIMAGNVGKGNDNVSVSFDNIFSYAESDAASSDYFSENWNVAGSDNILGDRESFWFKLFCYLRDILEQKYQDFYFRKESGVRGSITLDRPLNFRTYFDSYPFTLSALPRHILGI